MRTRAKIMLVRKTRSGMMASILLLILLLVSFSGTQSIVRAEAGGPEQGTTEYQTVTTIITRDGRVVEQVKLHGPSTPPPGYEAERAQAELGMTAVSLAEVPAYTWVFGSSAVAAAMIAGYYDRTGYSQMYTGPANGGVAPPDNSTTYWDTWSDGSVTYPNLPLAASHNGVDGRLTRGSIDDYWYKANSSNSDPYISGGWAEHTWGSAVGDYMKTGQSEYSLDDGETYFQTWYGEPKKFFCTDMSGTFGHDGTYGRKLFYEARGYTVGVCYNQRTDNNTGSFTYANYKAEIDAGHPVLINLEGHSVVGFGYEDPGTVILHDSWDTLDHTMPWGGTYNGLAMQSVSIVHPGSKTPIKAFNTSFNGTAPGWRPVRGIWGFKNAAYYYSDGLPLKTSSAKYVVYQYSNFTYNVQMKRTGTCSDCANRVIIRGDPTMLSDSYSWGNSYLFQYTNNGNFSVYVMYGTYAQWVKKWTYSSAIVKNGWNDLTVVANGSSLKFLINGTKVWSGKHQSYTNGYVGFGFYRDNFAGTLYVNYAQLDPIILAQLDPIILDRLDPIILDPNPFDFEPVAPGVEQTGGTVDQSP
jgi:hypothetical protein